MQTLTTNGGTLTFGVTSTANHGEIVIAAGAATLSGETITVDVAGGNTLSVGDKILIIDGTGALVGGPGSTPQVVADNSASFNFEIVDGVGAGMGNADDLYLEVLASTVSTTISTATSSTITLNAGDSLSVTNAGSIVVGSGSAVTTSAAASTIDNAGLLEGPTGITVSGGSVSSITNETTGTIDGTGGTAIALTGLTGATPLTINGGQVIGNVTDNAPANGDSATTIAGNFTTDGNFTVSSFGINSGETLTLGAGNNINSHSAVADSGTMRCRQCGLQHHRGFACRVGRDAYRGAKLWRLRRADQ